MVYTIHIPYIYQKSGFQMRPPCFVTKKNRVVFRGCGFRSCQSRENSSTELLDDALNELCFLVSRKDGPDTTHIKISTVQAMDTAISSEHGNEPICIHGPAVQDGAERRRGLAPGRTAYQRQWARWGTWRRPRLSHLPSGRSHCGQRRRVRVGPSANHFTIILLLYAIIRIGYWV